MEGILHLNEDDIKEAIRDFIKARNLDPEQVWIESKEPTGSKLSPDYSARIKFRMPNKQRSE